MNVFTFGLAKTSVSTAIGALLSPPAAGSAAGLVHAEILTQMRLGSSILSPQRMQMRSLAMFAAWETEDAIDEFQSTTHLGRAMASGWHLRMSFLRRWGSVRQFADLPEETGETDPSEPVAAFTLARMRILEVPRFIRWGRPVEQLVRDHPEASLAIAAIRYPRSVATFSIWNSHRALREMVEGHSNVERPGRHADAMKERDRRDFHHEFTTLRFRPISEHGSWAGRSNYVPTP